MPEVSKSPQTLELSLRKLWDKIRAAGELIQQLRQENASLKSRTDALVSELSSLRGNIVEREQEIKQLRAERTQLIQTSSGNGFSDEEKEILKSKIRELIAKINSHL